jgi:glycosyltransferase involved in cell wall biosynthesis
MASGLAVVATDCPGNREAVGPDGAERLVPPRDHGALAGRIVELAADPARRAALGEANRRRVAAEFDCLAMGRRMAAILAEAMGAQTIDPHYDPRKAG